PIPPGDIADTIAHATFVPTKATLSLAANDGNIDRENQAALSFRNSVPTLYAAIHESGNENVMGVVAGRETDWQNASVRATPFPNAANTAALASARHAVLVLRPVPFVVRRQLASNGLPVSVFMPTFLWGNHPLAANLPLIVGGGCGVTFFLVILLWPQRDREPPPPPGQG
ncbi:MAG: hypothetical protein KDN22_02310, partial [Verrucomicrobiae bacterium]|nr:hypothetical protein [Verrucomicrobiae bacterium]